MKIRLQKHAGKIILAVVIVGLIVATAQASESGAAEHKSLIALLADDPMPLLKDFLWRIINIVVLMWILVKFAGKPFRDFFIGRRTTLEKGVSEAAESKLAAEKVFNEYQAKLNGLDDELKAMEEKARREAEREQERMRLETEALVLKLKDQARQMADQEVASAQRSLRDEAARLAVEIAEQMVKDNIDDRDRQRMVDNYLEKVAGA